MEAHTSMRKGTYYKTCDICGAHLDPGEKCECTESTEEARPATIKPGIQKISAFTVYDDGENVLFGALKSLSERLRQLRMDCPLCGSGRHPLKPSNMWIEGKNVHVLDESVDPPVIYYLGCRSCPICGKRLPRVK